jgi:hypothetical protein
MKKIGLALLFVVVLSPLTLLVSCSDDNEPSTEGVSEIAGNWTATMATFNGTDVVAGGGSVTLVIESNSKFVFTIKRPEQTDLVFTGRLGFDEEWLVFEWDSNKGEYEYYDYTLDAKNLHIGANANYDFDGDGKDEFVIFFLDMVR